MKKQFEWPSGISWRKLFFLFKVKTLKHIEKVANAVPKLQFFFFFWYVFQELKDL